MKSLLITWIGQTDLNAPNNPNSIGPIAMALDKKEFDHIHILSDYNEKKVTPYIEWLQTRNITPLTIAYHLLSSPIHFGEIFQAAIREIQSVLKHHGEHTQLTYFLSPGTPAMAAVWILVAKTKYPAQLLESSIEQGVRVAVIPFDISAEFIPDLLQDRDNKLAQLSTSPSPEYPEFSDIVFRSATMQQVISMAQRVAIRSVPVLIEGESGTGKELFAKAIHRASPRRDKPFITVNCGAIPADLIESELFGHEKGAFTGAVKERVGYFEAANNGTLFLDEIGELPILAQVKLLRVLQESEVTRIGAVKSLKINVRIIAATNRMLLEEINQGTFREDLFYRLAVGVIQLPPLREREGDLSLLIDHLLRIVNKESAIETGEKDKKLSPSARNLMLNHYWPGNVRELLNTLRRTIVWTNGDTITETDMKSSILQTNTNNSHQDNILNNKLNQPIDLTYLIEKVASYYLKLALEKTSGNKTEAAKLLGLPSYQTLTNWLKKYDIEN